MTQSPANPILSKPAEYKKLIEAARRYPMMQIEAIRENIVTLRLCTKQTPTNTRMTLSQTMLETALSRGLLKRRKNILETTDAVEFASKRIRKTRGVNGTSPFTAQHQDNRIFAQTHDHLNGIKRMSEVITKTMNTRESPLIWLHTHKARDGKPHISQIQFSAGQKLEQLYINAGLNPRMGINWAQLSTSGVMNSHNSGKLYQSEHVMQARDRLNKHLKKLGPEFAGVLVDVCCYQRGLDDLERHYGWPERSAKVVLKLGLDKLARQFGIA